MSKEKKIVSQDAWSATTMNKYSKWALQKKEKNVSQGAWTVNTMNITK